MLAACLRIYVKCWRGTENGHTLRVRSLAKYPCFLQADEVTAKLSDFRQRALGIPIIPLSQRQTFGGMYVFESFVARVATRRDMP